MSNINIETIEAQDVPKYIKKKPSNKSKSFNKTKHKHDYTGKCLVKELGYHPVTGSPVENLYVTTYCSICGKIKNKIRPSIDTGAAIRMMENDEILAAYKDLDIIVLDDIFSQYVPIANSL